MPCEKLGLRPRLRHRSPPQRLHPRITLMRAGVGGDLVWSAGSLLEPSLEARWQGPTIIRTGTMGIMLRLRFTTITTRRRHFITDTAPPPTAAGAGAMARRPAC